MTDANDLASDGSDGPISACIVVPTYKRPELLERTLRALSVCEWPPLFRGIWVVENRPQCGADQVCTRFSDKLPVHYVFEPTPGLSNARNVGVRESEGDIVLFLDDDVRPQPGALTAYARAFQNYGGKAFYGGPVYADYEVEPPDWLTPYLPMSAFGFTLGPEDRDIDEASSSVATMPSRARHWLRATTIFQQRNREADWARRCVCKSN